jgi:hypothetical protein
VARARLHAGRLFGDQQAALGDGALPRLILGRVEDVDAAGDDPMVPVSSAPSWAAVSMPRASPRPRRTRVAKRLRELRAKRQAAADALRAPTIAMAACRAD